MTIQKYIIDRDTDLQQMRASFLRNAVHDVISDAFRYVLTNCEWKSNKPSNPNPFDPTIFDPRTDHSHKTFSLEVSRCLEQYISIIKNE